MSSGNIGLNHFEVADRPSRSLARTSPLLDDLIAQSSIRQNSCRLSAIDYSETRAGANGAGDFVEHHGATCPLLRIVRSRAPLTRRCDVGPPASATYRKMIQNVWWAAEYNIFAIPLAAGVLASWGIVLPAAMGAVLMSLSTIVVAVNAQLLRRAEL